MGISEKVLPRRPRSAGTKITGRFTDVFERPKSATLDVSKHMLQLSRESLVGRPKSADPKVSTSLVEIHEGNVLGSLGDVAKFSRNVNNSSDDTVDKIRSDPKLSTRVDSKNAYTISQSVPKLSNNATISTDKFDLSRSAPKITPCTPLKDEYEKTQSVPKLSNIASKEKLDLSQSASKIPKHVTISEDALEMSQSAPKLTNEKSAKRTLNRPRSAPKLSKRHSYHGSIDRPNKYRRKMLPRTKDDKLVDYRSSPILLDDTMERTNVEDERAKVVYVSNLTLISKTISNF